MAVDTYFQLGTFKSSSQIAIDENSPLGKTLTALAARHEAFEIADATFGVVNDAAKLRLDPVTVTLTDDAPIGRC